MTTKTSEAWKLLGNYDSRELLARSYKEKHTGVIKKNTADICADISANIIQARQYFEAAEIAHDAIRPLVLYYGVLGLSRALILFLNCGKRESTLNEGHGLGTHAWAQTLSPQGGGLEKLQIKVSKNGTFRELIAAVENRSLIRCNGTEVDLRFQEPPLPENELLIRYSDMIERTPGIGGAAERWLPGTLKQVAINFAKNIPDKGIHLTVNKLRRRRTIDFEFISQLVPGHPFTLVEEEGDTMLLHWDQTKAQDNALMIWDAIMEGPFAGFGTAFIVPPINGNTYCQISSVFIHSYVLGMLARYFPSYWTKLTRNERNDASLPTIKSILSLVEARYPQMILDFLEERPA